MHMLRFVQLLQIFTTNIYQFIGRSKLSCADHSNLNHRYNQLHQNVSKLRFNFQ